MVNNIEMQMQQVQESVAPVTRTIYDAGNGQVTATIDDVLHVMDTGIRRATPVEIKWSAKEAFEAGLMKSIYVSVTSTSIVSGNTNCLALGEQIFNGRSKAILTKPGKTEANEPLISLFAMLAANALQKEYEKTKDANTVVGNKYKINVDLLTALPEAEASAENREKYKARYLNGSHDVVFHLSAKETAKVEINFVDVEVKPEGVMALMGVVFNEEGEPNEDQEMFGEVRTKYADPNFNGESILAAPEKTITIDIGEITSEIHVFQGLEILTNYSRGIEAGSAAVYELAADQLMVDYNLPAKKGQLDRREITRLITNPHTPNLDRIIADLEDYALTTADEIAQEVDNLNRELGGEISNIVVFGGGSIIMRAQLEPMLEQILKRARPNSKVVYVPKTLAQKVFNKGLVLYKKLNK